MKIIPKGQYGLITQSDNTRVAKPIIQERIPYKLKPNEFYFIDKKTGKKTLIKQKQETVSADNRTTNQRKQDQARTKQIQKKQEADKNYNDGLKTIGALTTLAMPSTYIGPVFNNNGKSYLDNVISGEGTGNTAGNLAIDIFTPFGIKGINKGIQTGNRYYLARQIYKDIDHSTLKSEQIPLNIGWGPKQTIPVSRASNSGNMQLFFPNRWDVVNEGANPHGIWFQGKLGYPRTDFTNPGKGEKAAKARALFANRSMQTQGDLTLEKPIITIGDVPSRSQLSYYADNVGADGLIYNGVYDNGYNNNQVILSFKKLNKTNDNKYPIKPSIGDINTFNSFDLSSSLKNGQWDMPTITQQLRNGTLKAREFLNSETRLSTYAHNKELAKRLGFGTIEEPYNSTARANKPFQPKLTANNSTEGGSFIPGKQPQQDIIEINLAHQVEPAAFHESLHRGSYGMGSLEGLDDMITFKNTKKFYEYLSDKLKKPWSQQPSSMRDYLDKPGELPVNVLELGQRMGIQIGQKYPGKTKFNTIIDQFRRDNPNDGKLFILDYLNMNKPKRVWDALSGQYFTVLPAIYGGYKATEE